MPGTHRSTASSAPCPWWQGRCGTMGHVVEVIGPDRFRSMPCPTYPGIRIPLLAPGQLEPHDRRHPARHPAHRHRRACWAGSPGAGPVRRGVPFTTSLHTRFPEYIQARTGIPARIGWMVMRRFHAASSGTMAATPGLLREMEGSRLPPSATVVARRGRVAIPAGAPAGLEAAAAGVRVGGPCGRGKEHPGLPGPGSAGIESGGGRRPAIGGVEAPLSFGAVHRSAIRCALGRGVRGSGRFRVSVTNGHVRVGAAGKHGLRHARGGLSGVRPIDVVVPGTGVLDDDLRVAALGALRLDRAVCRAHAERCSWDDCAQLFLSHLVPLQSHAVPEKHA